MKKYTVVFCDDDDLFLKNVLDIFYAYFNKELFEVYTINSLRKLEYFLKKQKIHILFLDYKFNNINSFNFLENNSNFDKDTLLIFLTAYDNLIFEGLKFDFFWFIRKNRIQTDFIRLVPKLDNRLSDNKSNEIVLLDNNISIILNRESIKLIESFQKNKLIIYENKAYIIRSTFKSILPHFKNDNNFLIPTYGKMVNCNYIKFIDFSNSTIELLNNSTIPISRAYKKDCKNRYFNYINNKK